MKGKTVSNPAVLCLYCV